VSRTLVLDTDFLSAFLKIERLSLVRDFYGGQRLSVPPAVYEEVSLTQLLPQLAALDWLDIEPPDPEVMGTLGLQEAYHRLGRGEQEAIALARSRDDALLLTNDNQARLFAAGAGMQVVNIPAFLLACKLSGLSSRDELFELVTALESKDRYGFRADVRALLLS